MILKEISNKNKNSNNHIKALIKEGSYQKEGNKTRKLKKSKESKGKATSKHMEGVHVVPLPMFCSI